MNTEVMQLALICLLLAAAFGIVLKSSFRSSVDVLEDLRDDELLGRGNALKMEEPLEESERQENESIKIAGYTFDDELAEAGLIEEEHRKVFLLRQKLIPIVGSIVFLILNFAASPSGPFLRAIFAAFMGYSVGHFISKYRLKAAKVEYKRSLEFFLPVVMERIVMAVQAGLDIIPALSSAIEIGESEKGKETDPVTVLLKIVHGLTESGISFEKSLKDVASHIEHPALRHAFLHLAVAQKEGGEIIMPLRELSDSTQLYFQESVEEQIAQMPVKATMPLLCTFAGLLVCFLVPPVLQVMKILKETMPQ